MNVPVRGGRRATARDVARVANLSVATVSLIVNGKSTGRVSPKTEERVWEVVRQLDYRVNSTASALARGIPQYGCHGLPRSHQPVLRARP